MVGGIIRQQFCEIISNLDRWFRRKRHLKVFLIWSSGSPFSAERNHLCNFRRGITRNNSVNFFLNMSQWFRRWHLKYFLSVALVVLLISVAEPFYAILKEGIMGNIHVTFYEIWTSAPRGDIVLENLMDGCTTDDRQRPITIVHNEPLAQVS